MQEEEGYTARQLRELEYHREHAKKFRFMRLFPGLGTYLGGRVLVAGIVGKG